MTVPGKTADDKTAVEATEQEILARVHEFVRGATLANHDDYTELVNEQLSRLDEELGGRGRKKRTTTLLKIS